MTSTRTLHLIRHGNYNRLKPPPGPRLRMDASNRQLDGGLTALGRDQAKRTAKRLADMPLNLFYSSTLPRALETSEIIIDALEGVVMHTTDDLWECIPHMPVTMMPKSLTTIEAEDLNIGQTRAEGVFDRFFVTPNETDDDTVEVLVCHGNLIRYLVARALRVNLDAWVRMRIHHCGMSTVQLDSTGLMRLVSYNDTGHLPFPMVTS